MQSMPDEHFLLLHIHELLTYLHQQGVVTLLITAQNGLVGPLESPIDASYLADAMLALRFFESSGRIRQAISMIKTLEQKVQERDQFLAVLAHELRNPLSVISNSLLLLSQSVEAKGKRPLELATRQTKVIGRLFDDLLDVARFVNGKIGLEGEMLRYPRSSGMPSILFGETCCKSGSLSSPLLSVTSLSMEIRHV